MKHKGIDAISKLAWDMLDHSKTKVKQNVATMVGRGDLKVDRAVLPNLLLMINASIDQGYNEYSKTFVKNVEKILSDLKSEETKKKS